MMRNLGKLDKAIIAAFIVLCFMNVNLLVLYWRLESKITNNSNNVIVEKKEIKHNIEISHKLLPIERSKLEYISNFLKSKCNKKFLAKRNILSYYLYEAGKIFDINPMLLAEIMILESRCDSFAVNETSGAKGLMQIHPYHNTLLYTNDFENIIKGAEILANCISIGECFECALECYGKGTYDNSEIVYLGTKLLGHKYTTKSKFKDFIYEETL